MSHRTKNTPIARPTLCIGIDASLSCTGMAAVWAVPDKTKGVAIALRPRRAGFVETNSGALIGDRLWLIAATVARFVIQAQRDAEEWYTPTPVRLAIEDFSRGSKFGREEAGMVQGAIRALLWKRFPQPVLAVAIISVKILACPEWPGLSLANWAASGNEKKYKRSLPPKEAIASGLHKRFGVLPRNEHEADAYGVAIAAALGKGS